MSYIFTSGMAFLAMLKPDSKAVKRMFFILLVILFGFNTLNPDYSNWEGTLPGVVQANGASNKITVE